MTDRETFRRNFVELLRITKIKQKDLAKSIDVSFQTVSAWATGRGYPRADALEKICRYFGIKKSVLLEPQKAEVTQEDRLLNMFLALSDEGKSKLMERASELTQLYPARRRKSNGETEKAF